MQVFKYNPNSELGIDILVKPNDYQLQEGEFDKLPEEGTTPYKLVNGQLVGSTPQESAAVGQQWLKDHGYPTGQQLTPGQVADAAMMKQLALLTEKVNELEGNK